MTQTIPLPEKLDTRAAPSLVSDLKAAWGGDVVLDAAATVQIGGLCLQALLVAAAGWAQTEQGFGLSNLSDTLAEQLGSLGVDPEALTVKEA